MTVKEWLQADLAEISGLLQQLDEAEVSRLMQAIRQAPAIFVAGQGRSGLVMRMFACA